MGINISKQELDKFIKDNPNSDAAAYIQKQLDEIYKPDPKANNSISLLCCGKFRTIAILFFIYVIIVTILTYLLISA